MKRGRRGRKQVEGKQRKIKMKKSLAARVCSLALPAVFGIGVCLLPTSLCHASPPKKAGAKPRAASKTDASKATLPQRLIQAVQQGDADEVETLLATGGNPNAVDTQGRPLLVQAVLSGKPDIIGNTEKMGDADIVLLLLERGAKINARGPNGNTAFALSATVGNKEICELLIQRGADINTADNKGITPLMYAVARSNLDIVNLLLTKPVNINAKMRDGVTALSLCVLLMQAQEEKQAKSRLSVLPSAQFLKDVVREDIFVALLEKDADVNARLTDGITIPMLVAAIGSDKMLRLTLNRGVDINAQAAVGTTALMAAAETGNAPGVKILLAGGADPNIKNNAGVTALMIAAQKGRYVICELLLKKGADPALQNKAGETARALAENANLTGIVNLLKQAEKP